MSVTIDTSSEPGSWAETLASPSCKIPTDLALLANAGASSFSPVNLPAVADNQGGGRLSNHSAHGVHYGE